MNKSRFYFFQGNTRGNTPGVTPGYFLFGLFALCFASDALAQRPEKFLVRRDHPEGIMFFIEPQSCRTDEGVQAVSDFTLDHRDSAAGVFTIAFTLPSREPLRSVDSARLYNNANPAAFTGLWERYYVEPKGKKWTNRYAIRFTPEEGLGWLTGEGAPTFVVYSGGRVTGFRFGVKETEILRTLGLMMAIETEPDRPR